MLRIEVYPVLDALMVSLTGVDHSQYPHPPAKIVQRVQRRVPREDVETLGIDEAIRDVVTDVLVLYPGLLSFALR